MTQRLVGACQFHEKLDLRLDASSFASAGRASPSERDRPGYRKGHKRSDHAPLMAELRD